MYITNKKEQFGLAYLSAIAAQAGCNRGLLAVDDESVDIFLRSTEVENSKFRTAQIDIQLKSTQNHNFSDGFLYFQLPIKNYNDLRDIAVNPRILVVVCIPENIDNWTMQDETQLILRHCGYWLSLYGAPDVDNLTSVNVKIPKDNIFSVDFLREAMQKIANGYIL